MIYGGRQEEWEDKERFKGDGLGSSTKMGCLLGTYSKLSTFPISFSRYSTTFHRFPTAEYLYIGRHSLQNVFF